MKAMFSASAVESRPAPAVYKPQQVSSPLQTKVTFSTCAIENRPAPPVYKPQQRSGLLQAKTILKGGVAENHPRLVIRKSHKIRPVPKAHLTAQAKAVGSLYRFGNTKDLVIQRMQSTTVAASSGTYLPLSLLSQPSDSRLCWAACVQMLMAYYNLAVPSLEDIRKTFGMTGESQSGNTAMMQEALNQCKSGINLTQLPFNAAQPEQLEALARKSLAAKYPVVLAYTGSSWGHIVILKGYDPLGNDLFRYYIADPAETDEQSDVYALDEYNGGKLLSAHSAQK